MLLWLANLGNAGGGAPVPAEGGTPPKVKVLLDDAFEYAPRVPRSRTLQLAGTMALQALRINGALTVIPVEPVIPPRVLAMRAECAIGGVHAHAAMSVASPDPAVGILLGLEYLDDLR